MRKESLGRHRHAQRALALLVLGDGRRDARAHVAHLGQRRVEAVLLELLAAHHLGDRGRRDVELLHADAAEAPEHDREPHGGEDVGVVALAGAAELAAVGQRGEGAARGEDDLK